MEKIASGWKARWKALYHRSGIQMILSIAFTAVAVVGMLFLGIALLLRFSSSANEVAAENSQRVLAQVNWSLDGYLRNMMRVSDTVYYRSSRTRIWTRTARRRSCTTHWSCCTPRTGTCWCRWRYSTRTAD